MEGAELEFTDGALRAIAKLAKEKDTGARGLRSIVEDIMNDAMFDLPDQETQGQVHRHRRCGQPQAIALRDDAEDAGEDERVVELNPRTTIPAIVAGIFRFSLYLCASVVKMLNE